MRFLLPLALLMMGCTAESAESTDATDDEIIEGAETFEHPEVGMLHNGNSYCTATLIRPNVLLTAAHCVTGGHKDEAVTGYSWDLKPYPGVVFNYVIDRAYTVPVAADFDNTQNWRLKDIALLRLTASVPAARAKPLAVATARPTAGADTIIYGYGCISRTPDANGHRPGGGLKRKADLAWHSDVLGSGQSSRVCPGDSGGPWLDVEAAAVFGTTSGIVNGDDRFGDIPASAPELNRVADAWAGGD